MPAKGRPAARARRRSLRRSAAQGSDRAAGDDPVPPRRRIPCASSSRPTARRWSLPGERPASGTLATGRLLRSFDAGWEVVPSPDGGTLFAAGRGSFGRSMAPPAESCGGSPSTRRSCPNRLAISPDGKALAVLLAFRSQLRQQKDLSILILFDADTLAVRWRIEKDCPTPRSWRSHADGRMLAIAGPAEGARSFNMMGPKALTIRLLEVAGGAELRRIPSRGVRRRVAGVLARWHDARRGGRRPDHPAL